MAITAVAIAGLALVGWLTTFALYSNTTTSTGNSVAAGTVVVGDDDSATAMFTVANLKPGASVTKCIQVTYTGSLSAKLRLYASAQAGATLSPYLNTTVEEGSGGTSSSCATFDAYRVAYKGTLAAFGSGKTSFTSGVGSFYARATSQTRSYRVKVTLDANAPFNTNGTSASVDLRWETRNAVPSTTDPTFTQSDLSTTKVYWEAVTADFNGDGRPDIAAGSTDSNTVDVWLSSGAAGSFTGPTTYAITADVRGLVAADLDGNGSIDLAAAGAGGGGNQVTLRFNNGSGAFPTTSSIANNNAHDVAAGDLNGDGKVDLAVVNFNPTTYLRTYLGDGAGGVSLGQTITLTGNPYVNGVDVGDVNGDGRLDVAAGGSAYATQVALGKVDGTLDTPVTYASSGNWVRLADVDSDGRRDLLTSPGSLDVRLNTGTGTFGSRATTGSATSDLAVGDLNGDDIVDIAADASSSISVFRGDGAGGFTSSALAQTGGSRGIAMADFDSDGKNDLAFPDNSGMRLAINTTP